MQKINMDKIPLFIKEKKITKQEAVYYIWEQLYKNPQKYYMADLSEDELSDFLIVFVEKLPSFFDLYLESNNISFSKFLLRYLVSSKNTWLRQKIIRNVNEKTIETFNQEESEKDIHKYEIKEVENVVMEETIPEPPEKTAKRRIAEMAALVLTMKAYIDVDDEIVKKVSEFTGIEEEFIYEKIQELKEKNKPREEKRELLVKRRDNSFYYKRRYQIEMARLDENSKMQSELQEKYEYQEKSLAYNNELLKRRGLLTASNEQIASALGLRPRQVGFCISHIKKPENLEIVKKMLEEKNPSSKKTEEGE